MVSKFCSLVLAFTVATSAQGAVGIGVLSGVQGDVMVDNQKAKNGTALLATSVVRTTKGKCTLLIGEETVVHLDKETTISVENYAKESPQKEALNLDLKFGRLRALVANHKGAEKKFNIKTRTAVMGIRGTQVYVDVPKDPAIQPTFMTLEGVAVVQSLPKSNQSTGGGKEGEGGDSKDSGDKKDSRKDSKSKDGGKDSKEAKGDSKGDGKDSSKDSKEAKSDGKDGGKDSGKEGGDKGDKGDKGGKDGKMADRRGGPGEAKGDGGKGGPGAATGPDMATGSGKMAQGSSGGDMNGQGPTGGKMGPPMGAGVPPMGSGEVFGPSGGPSGGTAGMDRAPTGGPMMGSPMGGLMGGPMGGPGGDMMMGPTIVLAANQMTNGGGMTFNMDPGVAASMAQAIAPPPPPMRTVSDINNTSNNKPPPPSAPTMPNEPGSGFYQPPPTTAPPPLDPVANGAQSFPVKVRFTP